MDDKEAMIAVWIGFSVCRRDLKKNQTLVERKLIYFYTRHFTSNAHSS